MASGWPGKGHGSHSVNRPRHVVTVAEYGSEGRRGAPLAENLAVQQSLTWLGLLLSVRAQAFDDLGMPKCARLAASDNHKQCALLVADVDEPAHGRARERDSVPGAKLHRLALVLAPEEVPPAVEYYEGLIRVVGVVGDPVVRFDLQESDVQPLIYIDGRPGGLKLPAGEETWCFPLSGSPLVASSGDPNQ